MNQKDALASLRAAQDRHFEAEGIPMVLAIVRRCGSLPQSLPEVRAEGASLADAHHNLKDMILADALDNDLGALISIVQAGSLNDFERGKL